jgi:hypothetical protein
VDEAIARATKETVPSVIVAISAPAISHYPIHTLDEEEEEKVVMIVVVVLVDLVSSFSRKW